MPNPALVRLPVECNYALKDSVCVAAAGMAPLCHDGYKWITYAQTEVLSRRIAQGILALVPQPIVGISGYNNIEWACADFGCMLTGGVSVGIHMTNDVASAVHVINHAEVNVLFCTLDKLLLASGATGFWTVSDLLGACPTLRHVVIMDAGLGVVPAATAAACAPHVTLHSLPHWVASPCDAPLPDPDAIPTAGVSAPVTILYTSGSSVRVYVCVCLCLHLSRVTMVWCGACRANRRALQSPHPAS